MEKEFFNALPPEIALILGAVFGALGCILLVLKIFKEYQGLEQAARSTAKITSIVVLGFFSFMYSQVALKKKTNELETDKNKLEIDRKDLTDQLRKKDMLIADLIGERSKPEMEKELNKNKSFVTDKPSNNPCNPCVAREFNRYNLCNSCAAEASNPCNPCAARAD